MSDVAKAYERLQLDIEEYIGLLEDGKILSQTSDPRVRLTTFQQQSLAYDLRKILLQHAEYIDWEDPL